MERVKVFVSQNEDEWEDKGTGRVTFEFLPKAHRVGIVVVAEENAESLLIHAIGTGSDYCIQDDSKIIKWTESQPNDIIALSFEDENFCRKCFNELRGILQKNEKRSHSEVSLDEERKNALPEVTLATLDAVVKLFEEVQPFAREQLLSNVRSSELIKQLVMVFQQCEDLEDFPGCENCCRIARSLVLHADPKIAEMLFSEECALAVIGALEYDPDNPIRIKHRQFLKEKVNFKEVVPIKNEEILRQIHQIYRMQYVKDVILPRFLDETIFNCLSHIITMSHIDVVASLSAQSTFFPELFHLIKEKEVNSQQWIDLVFFLQDYCVLARQLQPMQQHGILLKLHKLGLFDVLTDILRDGCQDAKLKAMDILNASLLHDPSLLRMYILQTEKHPLFQLLIHHLIHGEALGLTEHCLDVIKQLLEPSEEVMNKSATFEDLFYNEFIQQLVDALAQQPQGDSSDPNAVTVTTKAKGAILDLLSFCVQTHTCSIKYCILKKHVFRQVLGVLEASETWLVISTVRFIRTLLGMKDAFYDQIVRRFCMLTKVVELLLKNGARNNLLNSTILELFEFIRIEKRHMHIQFVIQNHYEQLKEIDYVLTFQSLKLEYDKSHDASESTKEAHTQGSFVSPGKLKRDARALEKEEEDYFDERSDDNDNVLESMVTEPPMISMNERTTDATLAPESAKTGLPSEANTALAAESPKTKRLKGQSAPQPQSSSSSSEQLQ